MTITVNSQQQAIITVPSTDFEFTPDQGQVVTGNNYGQILSVSYQDDNYVVQTDKGTLTFNPSSPSLEAAEYAFSPFEIAETSFGELTGFNWLEIAMLIMDSEKLRMKTNRLVRQFEMDRGFNESMDAARQLRDAAKNTRKMGAISGVIGIVGGGIGCLGGLSNFSKALRAFKVKTKAAKFDADLASNTNELANTRSQLRTLRAKQNPTAADKAKIKELRIKEAKLQRQQEQLLDDLDVSIDKAKTSRDKAKVKYNKAKQEAKDAEAELNRLNDADAPDEAIEKQWNKLKKLRQKQNDQRVRSREGECRHS
jgi:hypothetical protein